MFRSFKIGLNNPITRGKLSLALGATSSICILQHSIVSNPFKNDYAIPTLESSQTTRHLKQTQDQLRPKYDGAFGGKLNYQELSIGSFIGLFTGIIIGKLSHVLWAVTLSSYLLIQWLNSRNIINFKFNKLVKFGSNQIDLKQMIFDKPSFNISFVLAFVISAWNV